MLAIVLAAGACNPPSQVTPGSTDTPSSGSTLTLSLKEYSITPLSLKVRAGTKLTFVARNDGTIGHALHIHGNGVDATTKDLSFAPGTSESITVRLPAGTYTLFCPVDGHEQLGMKATVTATP